jgi:hypothetical protein
MTATDPDAYAGYRLAYTLGRRASSEIKNPFARPLSESTQVYNGVWQLGFDAAPVVLHAPARRRRLHSPSPQHRGETALGCVA